jgi:hypothetical protein
MIAILGLIPITHASVQIQGKSDHDDEQQQDNRHNHLSISIVRNQCVAATNAGEVGTAAIRGERTAD